MNVIFWFKLYNGAVTPLTRIYREPSNAQAQDQRNLSCSVQIDHYTEKSHSFANQVQLVGYTVRIV